VKIFISWSGDRSKAIAEELRDWLPTIVQSLEPFMSTQDVPVGGRGLNVLASQLQECSFGILCLTQENKQGQWIHFEAGALSKVIDASRVVPLLLDLKVSDLTGPLVQFQAIAIEDRDGVFALIKALADQSSPPITESRLQRLFGAFWPELEAKVSQLRVAGASKPKQEGRSEREILEEILLLSRNTERQMSTVITGQARRGASSSGLMEVMQHAWEDILITVQGHSRAAWTLLVRANPISVSKNVLMLEFAQDKDVNAFVASGYGQTLSDAILYELGLRLNVRAVPGPGSPTTGTRTEDVTEKILTGMDLIQQELGDQAADEIER